MQEQHETYTYTARNINNPNKVVTFTLYDGHMRINLTGLLEQAETVAQAEQKPAELEEKISAQARPAMVKLVERVTGPVHVSDVNANFEDENLQVTLWQRVGGLRLAPVVFQMGHVDNVEAADAFVDELEHRKESSSHLGKFFGPLDYWIGWAGLLLLVGFLFRWPRKRNNDE